MTRLPPFRRSLALLAAGLLLAPPAAPTFAQEDLKTAGDAADPFVADAATLIPADAGVVIRIADPDSALTKLTAFVREAAPQHARQMLAARGGLGLAIRNVTLSGVNLKEPWYVVAVPRADMPPATVFLLPASNVQAMKEGVGPGMNFKVIGTYAAYTDADPDVLGAFGEGGGFVDTLPQGAAELAGASDVTLALNVPRLREVYRDKIDEGLEKAQQQAAEQSGGANADSQAQAIEAIKALLEQTDGAVVGFSATPEALTFKKISAFVGGSEAAEGLSTQRPGTFETLDRLPEGLDGYLAGEGDFGPIAEWLKGFEGDEPANPPTEMMYALGDAGLKSAAGGFMLGGEGGLLSGVQLSMVEDVAAADAAVRKYLKDADGRETGGLRTVVEPAGAMEVGGVAFQKFVTDLEVAESSPESEKAVEAFRTMFGEAGQESMYAATDDALVQITGGGDEFAGEVVAHLKGTSGHSNEALADLRESLPEKGNVFGAIDLATVIQTGLAVAIEKGAFPPFFDPDTIRGVQIESSYAAFVVTTEDNRVIAEGVLPAEQVRNIVDFAEALQGDAQGF